MLAVQLFLLPSALDGHNSFSADVTEREALQQSINVLNPQSTVSSQTNSYTRVVWLLCSTILINFAIFNVNLG